jgi:hypothetical protein
MRAGSAVDQPEEHVTDDQPEVEQNTAVQPKTRAQTARKSKNGTKK